MHSKCVSFIILGLNQEYVPVTLKVTGTIAVMYTRMRGSDNPEPNPRTNKKIWLAYFPKVVTAPASISLATWSGVSLPAYSLATASLMTPPMAEGIYWS